jgi:hypothetical protein
VKWDAERVHVEHLLRQDKMDFYEKLAAEALEAEKNGDQAAVWGCIKKDISKNGVLAEHAEDSKWSVVQLGSETLSRS